jgi:hypothetical protein
MTTDEEKDNQRFYLEREIAKYKAKGKLSAEEQWKYFELWSDLNQLNKTI